MYTNRKDLVVIDIENNIIGAINIYYNYSDGIFSRTKLFYVDEDYTISLRYYDEDEEGETQFSGIENYKIAKDGKIFNVE